jgi:hypothetical protein
MPATAEKDVKATAGWADHLASAVKDWVIGAVADRFALVLIRAPA